MLRASKMVMKSTVFSPVHPYISVSAQKMNNYWQETDTNW